ncbi:MAG: ABC transporter ATP-binding protein [Clostridia bacterium]|nr:ABC transporter ATP-binding protein [Clostridia bacterium]MBQ3602734.1 ABC transporter ATP-binding protein [Clostridia bacterium]MBQ6873565.1 ABC transporter ATP-binding protein [Clostridia bacterium]
MIKLGRYILKFLDKSKKLFVVSIFLSIINTGISAIIPYYIGIFIDSLISPVDMNSILRFIVFIFILNAFCIILNYVIKIINMKVICNLEFNILRANINHIQKIPMDNFFTNFNASQLTQRITADTKTIVSFYFNYIIQFFVNIIYFIFLIIAMQKISTKIVFIALLFIPIYILCFFLSKKKLFNSNLQVKEINTVFYKKLFEQLKYIKNIKTDVLFDISNNTMKDSFDDVFSANLRNTKLNQNISLISSMLSVFALSSMLIVSAYQTLNGVMSIGGLTTTNSYFGQLFNVISFYFSFAQVSQNANASLQRLNELSKIKNENNGNVVLNAIDEIALYNVKFGYGESDVGLNLTNEVKKFKKGSIYQFIGRNGSGKSTCINIILGIYQKLNKGTVSFNGIDLKEIDLYTMRKNKISVLQQDEYFPDLTVAMYLSNILNITDIDLKQRIKDSMLYGFFQNEDELDSFMQKKCNCMSGGQKQLAGLLKTFLKNADVYILDEPDTALDVFHIQKLKNCLIKLSQHSIIIIISHSNEFTDNLIYF